MEVTLSATEELPLRLCEYFDDELWAELFAKFCGLYPYASIPDKISNLFLNIIKILCKELNQTERQKLARCYLQNFEVIIEEEEIIIEMFKELVDNKQSSFTRNYIFVFRVLEKSLCDRSLVQRDLSHNINWRVQTSKGFYIVGYCLAVLLSPEYNLINKGATSYQTAIRINKKSKSRMMVKPIFYSSTKVQKCKQY
ncbi:hypothetical protein RhiirA5_421801 [Rhizophagus irregularis]|uniref:Uncharacterized protein n=1 Tax=Rhizophagus irregularis TaxID=588596 RepID=A0A2I1EWC8_9GLOM|nr:hypothetical protein RhiirA5_421801 [Rhizophagus irregularis]PKY26409.1 hypothetical protein RhiirB3_441709 [Rhizophagus irregularis]